MELAILNGTYRDANVKTRKDDIMVGGGGEGRRVSAGTGVHCMWGQCLCLRC